MQVSPQEYDLILRADMHTRGNTQWFYFAVRRTLPGVMYKFNILNNVKPDSLFNGGMQAHSACAPRLHRVCTASAPHLHRVCTASAPRLHRVCTASALRLHRMHTAACAPLHVHPACAQPLVYSTVDAERHRVGWRRRAHSVCYYQNHIKRRSSFYYTLSFQLSFQHADDVVYLVRPPTAQ